jgi:hypothetical protein
MLLMQLIFHLHLTLVKVISVPPVKVIASLVESLPAKLMFVVAAGTSIVYVVPDKRDLATCILSVPL